MYITRQISPFTLLIISAAVISFFTHTLHHQEPAQPTAVVAAAAAAQKAHSPHQTSPSWFSRISGYLEKNRSLSFTLVLVFFLGLLMSLTPCIYPMIPITVGILQSQGTSSIMRNFLLACAYTCGIATTFACFGLLAAYTGQLFGALMYNPFVILIFCALLMYLGFSMLGFYEFYMPSWLQPKGTIGRGGSYIAAFTFGAISGTVASPCISPGLVLLLSIVSHMQNVFLGFILLFIFGIGLSIPLLIIGTFSNALAHMPRAGMWMVRIKQLMGVVLLLTALYFFYTAFYRRYFPVIEPITSSSSLWITDFSQAQQRAREENKKILLKIYTPVCNLCTAIDRKIFSDTAVQHAIAACICVKLDATDSHVQEILKKYSIVGAPTIIIIDNVSGDQLFRWTGELYDSRPETFIEELQLFL
jgi:thiol:disulfide interchange protein